MPFARFIALDIGASHIAGGVFEMGKNQERVLRRFACSRFESVAAEDGRLCEQLTVFLREFVTPENEGTPTFVAIPGFLTLIKFAKAPVWDRAEQSDVVQFEASQLIPFPLAEVVWDHVVLSANGTDLEFMLAAAKLDAVQGFCDVIEAAGLNLQHVTPAALALRAGFEAAHPEATAGVIVAEIGARSTTLLFRDREAPAFVI